MVVAGVLNQNALLDAVQVHLVQNHFHRLEPVDAGVGMGVDHQHRVSRSLYGIGM